MSPSKTNYSYYNNPQMEEEKFYKGFMYTGDLGYWDKNHFITVAGRKDDMIVLAGKGHETYQEINGVKYHLDEREEVAAHLMETR